MATKTPTRRGMGGRKRVSKKPQRSKQSNRSQSGTRSKKPTARPKAHAKAPRRKRLATLRVFLRDRLGRQADDIWGVIMVVIGLVVGLGMIDRAGPVGRLLETGLRFCFGVWSYALPVLLVGLGIVLATGRSRDRALRSVLGSFLVFLSSLAMFHLLTGAVSLAASVELVQQRGGAVGSLLSFPLRRLLGTSGAFLILLCLIGIGIMVLTNTTIRQLAGGISDLLRGIRRFSRTARTVPVPTPVSTPRNTRIEQPPPAAAPEPGAEILDPAPEFSAPEFPSTAVEGKPEKPKKQKKPKQVEVPPIAGNLTSKSDFQLPPIDLLELGRGQEQNRRLLEATGAQLVDTLHQHGVDVQLTKIVSGPTVTRFEIELGPGVKTSRVTNLSNDMAYALATPDIRIQVPVPGKSVIGIEVPNRNRRLITLGDILRSTEAEQDTHPMSVGLGMDISGKPLMLNLSELPHVLIAGATGAGKSSCINSIVTSLLMRTTPDDVQMIMVDPKRVELGQYNGVPHLLTKVIVNPKKAADALKWAVSEMDRRYDLVAEAGGRDIISYRQLLDQGVLDPEEYDRFPYMVVIVDELNDLMMVAGREVESAVVRIAQMARAVGIHLVIATQRPSVDVITGVIKANVPSRLAFSVASQTDSRVIIDNVGAEKLIGMGDMLVVTAKQPRAQRIQGAWVTEEEIRSVVDWVTNQQEANYRDQEVLEVAAAQRAEQNQPEDDEDMVLVRQAMELVVRSQLGSTSMLQRKLRVGFARAGRIMDILEERGVVGPSEGSKARKVLMDEETLHSVLAGEKMLV